MSSRSYFYYKILYIFLNISICIEAYRPQEIILYSENNFTGKQKSFYSSKSDLQSDSFAKYAKSHCVVRGLWRISGAFDKKPIVKFMENAYGDEKAGNVCGSWNTPNNKTANYHSIHFIGAEDLNRPAITLNLKPRFNGDEELYFDGSFLRLPKPINFTSFGFSGKENWTIYQRTNFSGDSECLVANVDITGGYGITFNTNKSMTIGSISRGCGQEKALSRKITEPDTKKPGKKSSAENLINDLFVTSIIALFAVLLQRG